MGKWADYLISAVKYDTKNRIIQVKQHQDFGEKIGEGEIIDRDSLTSNLKHGKSYMTVFSSNNNWKPGDYVRIVKMPGSYSIRTDDNKVEHDNLKFVLELE